jgi:predicted small lipoprotein YifL
MIWDLSARTIIVALIVVATAACGKKGPPLLPYVRQAKASEITSARRVGNDVYLTVSVPTTNVDDSTPASVSRIQVFGVTATAPPPQLQFISIATLVTTIPVARYADPGDNSGKVVPDSKGGALQGATVTIRDTLTPEADIPRQLPATKGIRETAARATDAASEVVRRFYMTLPVSDRGRAGQPSLVVEVPMTFMPERVASLRAAMDGHDVVLQWEPAGGLLGWLLDRALPLEPAPVEDRQSNSPATRLSAGVPSGPALYNLYVDTAPDPLTLHVKRAAEPTGAAPPPAVPINPQPQASLTFAHDVPFDERWRCYYVRAVRGTGTQRVEGESSQRECLVPVDTEPPAQPTSLISTVVEGEVTLRWDPNGEEDLVGYVVLRGVPGSDTLQLLTTSGPTAETRFIDKNLMAGQVYTYLVQAVDSRIPLPNVSEAARIDVTAR